MSVRGMIMSNRSNRGRGEGTKRAKSGATNGILEQKIEWAANTGVWIGEFGYMPDLNVLIYNQAAAAFAAAQYSQQQYQYRLAGYAPAPSAPFGPF